jgi:tetratricopeptide (TPR) repeat protein
MKTIAPLSKSILLITCFAILTATGTTNAQRRGRGKPQKQTVSKAAGLVDAADKLADDKKYAEAIDTYKIAVRLDPNYAPAFGGLGDAYLNSGNSQQAEVAYKEQVRLAPNDADAQYDLGYFFNAMGRHGEAFSPLVKATSLDPSIRRSVLRNRLRLFPRHRIRKIDRFYRSAIKNKPDYADAYYGMGEAYARLGKADLATEQVKKLNTLDPKLARKLEKEMTTALAEANKASESTQQVVQATTPATALVQPANENPAAARKVAQISAPPKPSPSTTTASEPTSRQLQQGPPAQAPPTQPSTVATPPNASPATSAPLAADEVRALPASAKRWALVIGVDKYT